MTAGAAARTALKYALALVLCVPVAYALFSLLPSHSAARTDAECAALTVAAEEKLRAASTRLRTCEAALDVQTRAARCPDDKRNARAWREMAESCTAKKLEPRGGRK